MKFPEVALAVGESLEPAFHYVLERFEQAGFSPQNLQEITRQLPCAESIALFSINGSNCLYLFVVVTAPWEEELLVDVLNSLLSLRHSASGQPLNFRFLTAHPLPPVLAYLFEDSVRGLLECEALLEIRFDERMPLDRPTYLARQCQRWIQDYFHHTLYPHQLESLDWINQLILDHLRSPYLLDQPVDEAAYEPMNTLIALGCFVGEVLAHQPQVYGRWIYSPVIDSVALQLCHRPAPPKSKSWFGWLEPPEPDSPPDWEHALILNPIGKVVKLFREGGIENLTVFAEVVLNQVEAS
ncbi:hypothetical protein [Anthocerotibacter panamensis]|uniref:hypothetical protein n=1 Tax=Anthocerotibacter panamensis TaxID=2857077 RepID=UPI001C40421E|nr:hypothetical protein [Anthocerotibacter panamensis]